MIEFKSTPHIISTAGNPIGFLVHGTNRIKSPGKKFSGYLSYSKTLSSGDYFTLQINKDKEITFKVSRNQADEDNNVIIIDDPENDASNIIKYLQYDPFLAIHYHIYLDEIGWIILDALVAGKEFDIIMSNSSISNPHFEEPISRTIASNDNMLDFTIDFNLRALRKGEDEILNDYYINQLIRVDDTIVGKDILTVDSNSNSFCDFSEYLHSLFSLDLHFDHNTPINIQHGLIKKYVALFSEKYGTNETKMFASENHYVIPGRLRHEEFVKNNDLYFFLFNKFMSDYPDLVKTVYLESPEKLFFCSDKPETLQIICDTAFGAYIIGTVCKPENLDFFIFEINCSPEATIHQMRIFEDIEYSIYIKSSTTSDIISEVKKFSAKKRPYLLRDFLFVNSYGVPECYSFIGKKSEKNKYDRIHIDSGINESNSMPLSLRSTTTYTIYTSFISSKIFEWLKDFQRSLQIWEITKEDVKRCVLLNDSTAEISDYSLCHHFFEYKYTVDDPVIVHGIRKYNMIFDTTFDNTYN